MFFNYYCFKIFQFFYLYFHKYLILYFLLLKIRIEEKIINIKKFDNLKFIKKPHLIKIDAEGFEVQIIHGMMMTIKKYMPILLVEYKKEHIKEIIKILPHYFAYAYDLGSNSFKLFYPEKFNNIRNIYFIPLNKKINKC